MRDKLVAFVFLQTNDQKGDVADLLSQIPEADEVHRIAGEDCYVVRVRVSGIEQLGAVVRERIERIKSVCSTRTTLVLKTFKDNSKNATTGSVST